MEQDIYGKGKKEQGQWQQRLWLHVTQRVMVQGKKKKSFQWHINAELLA